jgi:hypothetical protein
LHESGDVEEVLTHAAVRHIEDWQTQIPGVGVRRRSVNVDRAGLFQDAGLDPEGFADRERVSARLLRHNWLRGECHGNGNLPEKYSV